MFLHKQECLHLKCFLINLDRSSLRLERMAARFQAIDLDFTLIQAVDGYLLAQNEVDRFVKTRNTRSWNYGEIGCFLSHLKTWQWFLESGEEFAAVFEDDVFLSNELTGLLTSSDWIPDDADIVRLETTFWKTEISVDKIMVTERFDLHRLLSLHHGSGAYIISKRAARFLLDNPALLRSTIDSTLFDFREKSCRALTIYQMNPAPAMQELIYEKYVSEIPVTESEIAKSMPVPSRAWALQLSKLLREIKRPFLSARTRLTRLIRQRTNRSVSLRINFSGTVYDRTEQLYGPSDLR